MLSKKKRKGKKAKKEAKEAMSAPVDSGDLVRVLIIDSDSY